MTRIYAFFITLLCTHSIAYAVGVDDVCDPSGSAPTEQCDNNLYCQEMEDGQPHVCQQCPETHPNSIQGQNNMIESCYKNCYVNPDFENGTWSPNESKVHYAEECQYNSSNISCNNSHDQCIGFHLEGTGATPMCVPNINFTECESGFKIYDSATSVWGECLITECETGYHLEITDSKCGHSYGNCVSDTHTCEDELTCDYGDITGNVLWQNNAYDYSDCKCNRTANLNYGTGTELCTWNGNTWSNCQITLETCIAGYWQGETENPTDCTQVSAGYYSAENELTRYACPAGSTSAADSDTKTDCYMTGGTTQICDGNTPANCFTLPNSVGNIYYHNGQ